MGVYSQYKHREKIPDGAELLISILLRYPEVGSVHYCQDRHALRFTFVVTNVQESSGQDLLLPALEVYHNLEGTEMQICEVDCKHEENVCILTITRDVVSMTQNEVGLIVDILKLHYAQRLVCDEGDLPEEELLVQEEMIDEMLATIKQDDIDKSVVAVREEGRVLVFKT